MRAIFNLLFSMLVPLTGCTGARSRILTGASGESRGADGRPPGPPLPLLAPVQVQPSIALPPPRAVIVLPPFVYHQADLRDCFLESSTDLVHWEERDDFTVTNGQWLVKMDPAKPYEFYRAGGEPLP